MQPTKLDSYPDGLVENKNRDDLEDAGQNHAPDGGPLATLTVIDAEPEALYGGDGDILNQGKAKVHKFNGCSSKVNCKRPGSDDDGLKLRQWKLCPGTKGYIQTNTGKNKWEKVGGDWNKSPDYSIDNTPGKPDIEAAGDSKANQIHPYIVLTEHKTGCNS